MKMRATIGILLFAMAAALPAHASEPGSETFDAFLERFDDQERMHMKIGIPEMLELYREGRVHIVDIRTPEERAAYHLDFMTHIPVDEFPKRLDELDRDKTIVLVCSVYVRAAIVRTYLTMKGYDARYLVDGMIGFARYLNRPGARESLDSTLSNR
jgi:rhodanese-related sulfurtransferase